MKQNSSYFFVIFVLSLFFILLPSVSASPAPDRAQQILGLLSAESQSLYEYMEQAQGGNSSNYETIHRSLSIAINNINILMDEENTPAVSQLQTALHNFTSDAVSAKTTADICSSVYADLLESYSRTFVNEEDVDSYEDCIEAGYHTDNGTCFVGGTQVFDTVGNLIGFYYADCYDANGFHPGSCWDCFYGADNSGCLEKP